VEAECTTWQSRAGVTHTANWILWGDGIYLPAGQGRREKGALVFLGCGDGQTAVDSDDVGVSREHGELAGSCCGTLRARGMRRPLLVIGDAGLGDLGSVEWVWTETRRHGAEPIGSQRLGSVTQASLGAGPVGPPQSHRRVHQGACRRKLETIAAAGCARLAKTRRRRDL